MDYTRRFYRDFSPSTRWESYRVQVETSDLYIRAKDRCPLRVQARVRELRAALFAHIQRQPEFLRSLAPVPSLPGEPDIVIRMNRAARQAGVGPMAAVAGAIAESVGQDLARNSAEVIVENGGDCFFRLKEKGLCILFAGNSPFSGKIGLQIESGQTPVAVCTSSGTVGPSYSLGRADAATIVSKDACLADAVATGTANRIQSERDFEAALAYAMSIQEVQGVVLIYKDRLAAQGAVALAAVDGQDAQGNRGAGADPALREGAGKQSDHHAQQIKKRKPRDDKP
jgi:ApbE superfamily uncharacterized protein (UPF0280 family)